MSVSYPYVADHGSQNPLRPAQGPSFVSSYASPFFRQAELSLGVIDGRLRLPESGPQADPQRRPNRLPRAIARGDAQQFGDRVHEIRGELAAIPRAVLGMLVSLAGETLQLFPHVLENL